MKKGFMRIIETMLVIMLLFTLMSAIVKQVPSIEQAKNIKILKRYATDGSNMVCNSDRSRGIVMSPAAMTWINSSMEYVMPENLKFNVIVVNTTDDSIIKSSGYDMPTSYDSDVATASCTVTRWGLDPRQVVVRVWR